MARMIDADRLADGLKLHRQPTDQKHEADRQWAVGYNAGLDRALHSIAYAPTLTQPNEGAKDKNVPTNEPLTLEELREMDEEPVYVVPKDKPAHCGGWCGVTVWKCDRYSCVSLLRDADSGWEFEEYGKTWIAYRRPPEGEKEENDVIEITENL